LLLLHKCLCDLFGVCAAQKPAQQPKEQKQQQQQAPKEQQQQKPKEQAQKPAQQPAVGASLSALVTIVAVGSSGQEYSHYGKCPCLDEWGQ